jgi:hypothetical protein
MTIENLQRENLSELEEARAFQTFLALKGDDAVEDLASRIGADPRYVRRRVHVLSLPGAVLDLWGKGELRYGHLEQLLRLGTEEEIAEVLGMARTSSVSHLRQTIDSKAPVLKAAKFSKDKAGCQKCLHNSTTQRRLFGDDFKTEKALCLGRACFLSHQHEHLSSTWKDNKYGTTGFRWSFEIPWNAYESVYKQPDAKCTGCERYVSLLSIDGTARTERACLDKQCYRDTYEKKTKGEKAKKEPTSGTVPSYGRCLQEAIPRAAHHGPGQTSLAPSGHSWRYCKPTIPPGAS